MALHITRNSPCLRTAFALPLLTSAMSEYWKSTPKYWCKHCSVYVRDTKLERTNHEATGKHQGAIRRSLRDLHRNHEQAEREKERAKREVERLNGVVSGVGPSARPSGGAYGDVLGGDQKSKEERQRQLEQLALMGVNIPTELRPEMAMAGEWTVTSTRIIKGSEQEESDKGSIEARAAGVRKREREQTEEEREGEETMQSLFKKPKKWGRIRDMPTDEDAELDELLGGTLIKPKREYRKEPKSEEGEKKPKIEAEDTDAQTPALSNSIPYERAKISPPLIERGSGEDPGGIADKAPPLSEATDAVKGAEPAVVFKKRKPKSVRQKRLG